jgi:hypothetical protein
MVPYISRHTFPREASAQQITHGSKGCQVLFSRIEAMAVTDPLVGLHTLQYGSNISSVEIE